MQIPRRLEILGKMYIREAMLMHDSKLNRRKLMATGLAGGAAAAALAACGETVVEERVVTQVVEVEKVVTEVVTETVTETVTEVQTVVEERIVEVERDAGDVEIFSWWTNAGEVEALNTLFKNLQASVPGINIINAAISGGSGPGGNAKAILETRMLAGEPPDSFQIHWGHELTYSHSVAGRVEALDDLWIQEGYYESYPDGFVENGSWDGHVWAVPVNIHRSNVTWFDKQFFRDTGIPDPTTYENWDDAFNAYDDIKATGRAPFAMGEVRPFYTGHVLENILLGVLGGSAYVDLFNGNSDWDGAGITKSLDIARNLVENYVNEDVLSIDPATAFEKIFSDGLAGGVMTINGDWAEGFYRGKGYDGQYGYARPPGTQGHYMALCDSFTLPVGAPNPENATAFLKVCGGQEGQDEFNHFKGSISVGKDPNLTYFNNYQKEAIRDWQDSATFVAPSVVHGFAARQSWITEFVNIGNTFTAEVRGGDSNAVANAQAAMQRACEDSNIC